MSHLARGFAIVGGLVLTALIVMTCLSIAGRSLSGVLQGVGVGPIAGDFELVEAGTAFAIFAFLPICQLTGAHATVDIVTSRLPMGVARALRAAIEAIFAIVLVMIALQLFAGMESKRQSGQTTLLLQLPVWWGYAACVPGAVAAAIVAVYITAMRTVEATTGRGLLPIDAEA